MLRSHAITIGQLSRRTGVPIKVLRTYEGLGFLSTRHQFHLGEKTLYTWCALDTLAFPALLGRTARVISSCPVTGKEIRLTVTPEAITDLEPAGAVASVRLPGEDTDLCHVQEDICNDG